MMDLPRLPALTVVCGLAACSVPGADPRIEGPDMSALSVHARVLTDSVRIGAPCWVEVEVRNEGDDVAIVNGRLAVGYRDSQHRELFVAIFLPGSEEELGKETLLYERDQAAPSDYVALQPGDATQTSFDLFEWYEVPRPGEYEFVVSYQADETLVSPPAGTVGGVHRSPRTPLHVVQ